MGWVAPDVPPVDSGRLLSTMIQIFLRTQITAISELLLSHLDRIGKGRVILAAIFKEAG
jgi:hypothetical protein